MSVIATFTVSAADFVLGTTISDSSEASIRLDRVVPLEGTCIPYLWASDEAVAALEGNLQDEADIESFRIVDSRDGESLIRVEWAEELDGLLQVMDSNGATILEGSGQGNAWRLQVRFDDHDCLSEFFQRCSDHGVDLELEALYDPGEHGPLQVEPRLSETQRETLELALSEGYFDVPRRINLGELAERLDVSDSAVSQRLRRGVQAVLLDMGLEFDESNARNEE